MFKPKAIQFINFYFPADPTDREFPTEKPIYVVWAIGRLDKNMEPSFHDIYPKKDILINFNRKEAESNCFPFTSTENTRETPDQPWEKAQIFDRNVRTFRAYIGPSGGKKGYQTITGMYI